MSQELSSATTIKNIRDTYSGKDVRFKLKNRNDTFFGKIMALQYYISNREVKSPFCLHFDIIEDLNEFRNNRTNYRFKHLGVYEGQIEKIDFWKNDSSN